MAEDIAIVHTKAFTAGDSTEAAQAIADCISAAGGVGFWELDPMVTTGPGEIALRPTVQGFGDADNQRIAIRAQASGVLQFGYAPSGWVITSLADLDDPLLAPTVWSGFRNITGTATGFGATILRVWVAQYRDQFDSATAPDPASSLNVFVGTNTTWNHGAHVGRVIATDNASDPDNNIFGDAVLVGIPTPVSNSTATVNGWLRGSHLNNPANASVIRTGQTWWSYTRLADTLSASSLNNFGAGARVVPINVFGHGNAKPLGDDVTNAGIIGQCKYLRRHNRTIPFNAYLQSTTSEQIWAAVVPSTADTDHIILWAAPVEVL